MLKAIKEFIFGKPVEPKTEAPYKIEVSAPPPAPVVEAAPVVVEPAPVVEAAPVAAKPKSQLLQRSQRHPKSRQLQRNQRLKRQ
jgi:hypothetical protein